MNYDLIIIGGGPAGITAGIYASRQRLKTLLITKEFGGQMAKKTVEIENYPGLPKISGLELIKRFQDHLKSFEITIEKAEVIAIKKERDIFSVITKAASKGGEPRPNKFGRDKKEFNSKTVIIASGAEPKMLNIPGEKEYMGKGVSYCPMCDGPIFKGKIVAVIGGGDAGFETAIWMAKYAKRVFIIEYSNEVNAQKINQKTAKKTGKIEIITSAAVREIKGNTFVKSIIYQDSKSKKKKELKTDGVFVEIGYMPSAAFARDIVDLNDKGEIKADFDSGKTKTKGLFAAGDVDKGKCKQIVVACGEGAVAATSAYKHLQNLKL